LDKGIPVIDLFAGLGEGSSRHLPNGRPGFRIVLSIEKNSTVDRTLTLRAFDRHSRVAKPGCLFPKVREVGMLQ